MAGRQRGKPKLEPLNEEQLTEMKSVFSLFDQNGDGTIPASDLGAVMRALGQYPTEAELASVASEVDTASSGNGMVEFHEFVVVMSRRPYGLSGSEDELKTAFGPFDADDSGLMNVDEFRRAMTTMGERVTSEELDEILKHFTPDADGNIEYQELLNMMLK